MQPDGRFVMIDVETGKKRVELSLEAESQLAAIHVLAFPDQYLLLTHSPPPPAKDKQYFPGLGSYAYPMIHGRIYALDPENGQPQWQVPAFVDQYGLPPIQLYDAPVLTLMRMVKQRSNRSRELSVLMIDRRDGRIVWSKEDFPVVRGDFELTGDRDRHLVAFQLPNSPRYEIAFTDQPRPPEPPAQTGKASSHTASSHPLGKAADRILRSVFGGGVPDVVPPALVPKRDAARILRELSERAKEKSQEESEEQPER
jgi:hypothetical protein